MTIPEDMILKEGHRFSRAGQFLVIDLVHPSTWFLNRIDPVAMTVEICNHFETLEEAVLYAESLGMECGVAEFEVDIFHLAMTGTLRMRRGS